ncbi:MAG: sugar O-acetyltransferase [Pseudomonadota bacterium]|nr:sugar O-acetyltransferase [Pseudomonadota bacterium]
MKIRQGVPFMGTNHDMYLMKKKAAEIMYQINSSHPDDRLRIHRELLPQLFKKIGTNTWFDFPFNCDYGVSTEIGSHCYFNHHLSIGDSGRIKIGDYVLMGPYVGLYTAQHPLNPQKRKEGWQTVQNITIGNNVWIGANCTILGGVKIGNNSVIGAGSLVTKNIPANSLAYGVPCRVVRRIDHDG